MNSYLIIAVRAGKVVRLERTETKPAFDSARRLRALGWEVRVMGPGTWA